MSINISFGKQILRTDGVDLFNSAYEEYTIKNIEPSLVESINKYYFLEKEKKWAELYKYRSNQFQKVVSIEKYSELMERAQTGWILVDFQIGGYKKASDEYLDIPIYAVVIKFREKIEDFSILSPNFPREIFEAAEDGVFHITEETVWFREGEEWRCIECGIRFHIPLNRRMDY